MPKRHLTPAQAFDLRQALHVATLDALMASRRWEPGDLVFQGGTASPLALINRGCLSRDNTDRCAARQKPDEILLREWLEGVLARRRMSRAIRVRSRSLP